jgi:hypothetical protein
VSAAERATAAAQQGAAEHRSEASCPVRCDCTACKAGACTGCEHEKATS